MSAQLKHSPKPSNVLCKALFGAAKQLSLTQQEVAQIIGSNRSSISRLKDSGSLAPTSKQGELALLLIRIARSLFALSGGDAEWSKRFMRTHNKMTQGVPCEQIQNVQGLVRVLTFLDALRNK